MLPDSITLTGLKASFVTIFKDMTTFSFQMKHESIQAGMQMSRTVNHGALRTGMLIIKPHCTLKHHVMHVFSLHLLVHYSLKKLLMHNVIMAS
jgi:hypothetical protein